MRLQAQSAALLCGLLRFAAAAVGRDASLPAVRCCAPVAARVSCVDTRPAGEQLVVAVSGCDYAAATGAALRVEIGTLLNTELCVWSPLEIPQFGSRGLRSRRDPLSRAPGFDRPSRWCRGPSSGTLRPQAEPVARSSPAGRTRVWIGPHDCRLVPDVLQACVADAADGRASVTGRGRGSAGAGASTGG